MNKLTYSRRNDTYNGKVQFDTLTVWGWYSKDGHAYLNSDDGLLYADGASGYFSYWQVVEILRGTYR